MEIRQRAALGGHGGAARGRRPGRQPRKDPCGHCLTAARRGQVYTPATLAAAPPTDSAASLWRNTIPSGYGWLLAGVLEPGFVWSRADVRAAEHGSTAVLDRTVPIAFMGPGIEARVVHRAVRTVDIAPTLARLLGVRPSERLDGVPLAELADDR